MVSQSSTVFHLLFAFIICYYCSRFSSVSLELFSRSDHCWSVSGDHRLTERVTHPVIARSGQLVPMIDLFIHPHPLGAAFLIHSLLIVLSRPSAFHWSGRGSVTVSAGWRPLTRVIISGSRRLNDTRSIRSSGRVF